VTLQAARPGTTTTAPRSATPTLPRSLTWLCALVVLVGVAMDVLGALRTGISWDEPYHLMRLENFLHHGWFALDWAVPREGSTAVDANTVVYGPVTMLLLHGLAVLTGVEEWGAVSSTSTAYDVRHLGVLLIGLVGTAAAAATTRTLLGSWRWGLFTAAALTALPMWTGHLMFNIKDVPVASGYTLMTLALVSMVAPTRGRRGSRVWGLAAGIVLMVGTRPRCGRPCWSVSSCSRSGSWRPGTPSACVPSWSRPPPVR
jgi:hypothetical protein